MVNKTKITIDMKNMILELNGHTDKVVCAGISASVYAFFYQAKHNGATKKDLETNLDGFAKLQLEEKNETSKTIMQTIKEFYIDMFESYPQFIELEIINI